MLARALGVVAAFASVAVLMRDANAEEVLAEEVVAVVDKRAVLLSELEFEARLARARAQGPQTLEAPVPPAELRAALERAVERLLVFQEAERLQVFELAPGELEAAVGALRALLGATQLDAFMARWGLDDRSLSDVLQRELRAVRYLESRFRLASRPRELDVQAYLLSHRAEYMGRPSDEAAAEVRMLLAKERFERLVASFIADVRRRTRIQLLRDFDAPGNELPKSGSASASGRAGGER